MDVTPHEVRTVELRESWRGYRQDDVDELLDRVAATIERLQGQVDRLSERVRQAEEEAGMGREADEMLRRTLLLAQRTADAAVAEAQERARRLVAEAEAKAQSAVTGAETEARRAAVAERQRLEGEIRELARNRDLLRADVDALERIADDHRRKLRELFETELASLEARPMPPLEPAPEVTPVEVSSGATEVSSDAAAPVPEASPAPAGLDADIDADATRAMSSADIEAALDAEPELFAAPAETPESADASDPAQAAQAADAPGDEHALEGEVVLVETGDHPVEARPPRDVPRSSADLLPGASLDDDSFFAELKAAVQDDAPLGPRDEEEEAAWLEWATGESVLYDQDAPDDEGGRIRSVFRRR